MSSNGLHQQQNCSICKIKTSRKFKRLLVLCSVVFIWSILSFGLKSNTILISDLPEKQGWKLRRKETRERERERESTGQTLKLFFYCNKWLHSFCLSQPENAKCVMFIDEVELAVISSIASQSEGCGFNSEPRLFLACVHGLVTRWLILSGLRCASVNNKWTFVSPCSPAMNWQLLHSAALPSPSDCWEKQQTPTTLSSGSASRWWLDVNMDNVAITGSLLLMSYRVWNWDIY